MNKHHENVSHLIAPPLNKAEHHFLSIFFDALNKAGVNYAVLRNYSTLPLSAGGSDIDIMVVSSDIFFAKSILLQSISMCGGTSLGQVENPTFLEVYALGILEGEWWGVCIEFYTGVNYKSSVPLVNTKEFLSCVTKYGSISIIPSSIGDTIGVIKEIMAHDSFRVDKPQYLHSAAQLLADDQTRFMTMFSPLGRSAISQFPEVITAINHQNGYSLIRKFRYSVLLNAFKKSPMSLIYKRTVHELHRIKRYFRPPGTIIAILGVDGVGKTTIINTIKPILDSATHNATYIQHLRPTLLPPLSRIKGGVEQLAGPVLDPHGSLPSGPVGSLLRLIWLTLDYILGYWLKARLIIAKRPAIIIYDRYAYDLIMDPRRFRISLPGWVLAWFSRLVPQPNLILCLHAEPLVISARKHELPLAETIRQVTFLREFANTKPNAVLISTDGSIEEVKNNVLLALLDFFAKRAAHG